MLSVVGVLHVMHAFFGLVGARPMPVQRSLHHRSAFLSTSISKARDTVIILISFNTVIKTKAAASLAMSFHAQVLYMNESILVLMLFSIGCGGGMLAVSRGCACTRRAC